MRTHTAREAAVGLVYLVVVALVITFTIMVYRKDFSSYVTVSLRVPMSGNALQKGSDVKVRGVVVGLVDRVDARSDGADVRLDLFPDQAKRLPADVTGRLLPKTLFGEQYVGLSVPDGGGSGRLRSGDRITPDRSPSAIKLQKLFDDLLPVLQAVRPDQLSATLGEIATALRGPVSSDLATLIRTLGPYLQRLAPHVATLSADLDALAKVARTYTAAGPDFVDALNSLTTTSRTLVQQRAAFESGLQSLTSTADAITGFVGSSQRQIIGLATNSLPTLRTLAQYSAEFPCLAQALVAYIPKADAAFGKGTSQPGAHIVLHVVPREASYTPADRPQYTATTGPRCPYALQTVLANTALSGVPGISGASAPSSDASSSGSTGSGLGSANSPQENELIAELIAPTTGRGPGTVPGWASLLLGPALRGKQVVLQ